MSPERVYTTEASDLERQEGFHGGGVYFSPQAFSQRHVPAEWDLHEISRFSYRFWRELSGRDFARIGNSSDSRESA